MNRASICKSFIFLFVVLISGASTGADDQPTVKTYAETISKAHEHLDAGRVMESLQLLKSSKEPLRSFEYEYALSRANAATEKVAAPDLVRTIAVPKVETRYGVLNEVDRQVVFICRDGSLCVHDLAAPDGEPKTVSHEGGGALWSAVFSRDGKTLVSGDENGRVVVWDAKVWKVRQTVSLGEKWPVRELAVSPDGLSLVAESKTALELWSLAEVEPKKIAAVGERYNFGEGLAFSPQGDLLATGGMFDIIIHNAKTGETTKTMRHASYTMGLEFSPDGKRIASAPRGNVNKFLSVFDIGEGKPLFTAGPFANYVAGLCFSPDGKRIAATGPQKDVRLFDVTTGEVVLTLPRSDHTFRPAFTRDGRLLGWSEPAEFRYIELGKMPESVK